MLIDFELLFFLCSISNYGHHTEEFMCSRFKTKRWCNQLRFPMSALSLIDKLRVYHKYSLIHAYNRWFAAWPMPLWSWRIRRIWFQSFLNEVWHFKRLRLLPSLRDTMQTDILNTSRIRILLRWDLNMGDRCIRPIELTQIYLPSFGTCCNPVLGSAIFVGILLSASCWLLAWLAFYPWRWRLYASPKYLLILMDYV